MTKVNTELELTDAQIKSILGAHWNRPLEQITDRELRAVRAVIHAAFSKGLRGAFAGVRATSPLPGLQRPPMAPSDAPSGWPAVPAKLHPYAGDME